MSLTSSAARGESQLYVASMPNEAYVIVICVPAYRLDASSFAIESAFAAHLRLLRDKLGSLAPAMTVVAPEMSAREYEERKGTLDVVVEPRERIRFRGAYAADAGHLAFVASLPKLARALVEEISAARVVHTSISQLHRPFELPALLIAAALGKKTICVTDIDHNESSRMRLLSGELSVREFLVARGVYDTWREWQQELVARTSTLCLLKGKEHAARYSEGRSNVRSFLDAAFAPEHIIGEAALLRKIERVRSGEPLRLTYFGRLVAYKGVDHMLRAMSLATRSGARVTLHVIGDGPERARLGDLSRSLGLVDVVSFIGAVPFGTQLFAQLHELDVALAAPLSADTPRSALDSTASGQLIVAYDTPYYRELAAEGAAVDLVRWNDVAALVEHIIELDRDRHQVAEAMRRTVRFAQSNTQDVWHSRRVAWTRAFFPNEGAVARLREADADAPASVDESPPDERLLPTDGRADSLAR